MKAIASKVRNCTSCPLHKTLDGCSPVPGKGSRTAKIMIVEMSPSKEAFLIGEPFSQIEKQTLDKLTEGIPKASLYYTNLLKCPTKSTAWKYLKPCLNHFSSEYNYLTPKMIIAVGTPTKRLLDELMLNCAIPHIPSLFKILNGSKQSMEDCRENIMNLYKVFC